MSVLVAIDGSPPSERVVPWVRRLLAPFNASLRLLTVVSPAKGAVVGSRRVAYGHQLEDMQRASALFRLRWIAMRLDDDGVAAHAEVRFGDPVEAILAAASDFRADLIALAVGDGRDLRWWRTSVSEEVLRRAAVPVLCARRQGQRAG